LAFYHERRLSARRPPGFDNTATGVLTLTSNTKGHDNTANGAGALQNNTAGNNNTASGFGTLQSNTTGDDNTAPGAGALLSNVGAQNTADSSQALLSNTNGSENTADGVRYDQVNAMLLNEFLKEHRKSEEDRATIGDLKNEIATLTATIKEQAARIERISTQVQVSSYAGKVVADQR
jgi:hypothetical protein